MSGVLVILALLRAHQPLLALVEAKSMMAGTVRQGEPLPAIGIKEVSRNEFPTVSRAEKSTLVRARVQVTVHAKNYPGQKALVLAAKLGMGVYSGVIAGVKVRSVLRLDVGPDFSDDDAGIYQQSRDFMVTYIEPN